MVEVSGGKIAQVAREMRRSARARVHAPRRATASDASGHRGELARAGRI